jgi:DNA-directed RNA polymerase specialized sigma24 family protein
LSIMQQQCSPPARFVALQQALHDLDPTHRRVLALRFFQHRSTAEIARALRCTEASVKILQHQALFELQRVTTKPPTPTQEPEQLRSRAVGE